MKAYDIDLRYKVIRSIAEGNSYRSIAKMFCISLSTVNRYARLHRETGSVAKRVGGYERKKKVERSALYSTHSKTQISLILLYEKHAFNVYCMNDK